MKLLEDNARAHIHSYVINYLTEEGSNIMAHLPDLAFCNYWLNDYIKLNLIDQANEKSLARIVSKLMKNIPKEQTVRNCINNHGHYFEHLIK